MGQAWVRIALLMTAAGAMLAACGLDVRETKDEKRYVNICTQYIGEKYSNAEELCRCQWKGIRSEVRKQDLDEFFFKLTAGRRFETKASKLIDRIAEQCLEKLGPGE